MKKPEIWTLTKPKFIENGAAIYLLKRDILGSIRVIVLTQEKLKEIFNLFLLLAGKKNQKILSSLSFTFY